MRQPNDGSRPSAFALDQMITNEITAVPSPELDQHKQRVQALTDNLPPVDLQCLRTRAAALDDHRPTLFANNARWFGLLVAIAAVCLLSLSTLLPSEPDPGVRFRSDQALVLHTLDEQSNQLVKWDGRPLGPGSTVGFSVTSTAKTTVVVLSFDGAGATTVFLPADGDQPVALQPGVNQLQGTALLDATPGTEQFIAVFDVPDVQTAQAMVQRHQADLQRWADSDQRVELVPVPRAVP